MWLYVLCKLILHHCTIRVMSVIIPPLYNVNITFSTTSVVSDMTSNGHNRSMWYHVTITLWKVLQHLAQFAQYTCTAERRPVCTTPITVVCWWNSYQTIHLVFMNKKLVNFIFGSSTTWDRSTVHSKFDLAAMTGGPNSLPPDHDKTLHVTETPVLTTQLSVTFTI